MQANSNPLVTLADGTVKQVNPFSGTQVWTVPGRGNRPLGVKNTDPQPLTPKDFTARDSFGSDNALQTPPEKARVIRDASAPRGFRTVTGLLPSQLHETAAEFRRVPNLFEIVTYDYWKDNYGFSPDSQTQERMDRYLADPEGREHVLAIVRTRLKAAGRPASEVEALSDEELLTRAPGYFAGGHDVIIARRHFVDGATMDNQLASSGTLTVEEHRALTSFTVESIADLYRRNRYVRYVVAFQNWLKPAGASFDHLHKQLVAIDEHGEQLDGEVELVRENPNAYNEYAVDYAARRNLIIAENDYAVAFAGFGHRYPTLEIFSKSAVCEPWKQTPEEIDGMSDIIHACHAAAGPTIPCNEEWHHRPIDLDVRMPWRVMIKWRTSNLAGFEGGTKIYLNTISPWDLRDRVVPAMYKLRDEGKISADIHIATECECLPNSLKYNPLVEDDDRLA
nr:DUF4921 family protein [Corynebacterium lactis]